MSRALVIVDVQKDFVDGSLAIPQAEEIIPVIRRLVARKDYEVVAATRDWHPANHCSFKANGGEWPSHCVKGTWGSDYAPGIEDLITPGWHFVKGVFADQEEYSGAKARSPQKRYTLAYGLSALDVWTIDVVGLALDYCVLATATDLHALGYEVQIELGATRPVGDGSAALALLRDAGISVVISD